MLVLFDLGLSDEARFDFFSETVRVPLDVDRLRVMEYSIKYGCSDHRVPEDLIPLAKAAVGGQDQRSLLVAAGDKLEEQVRSVPVDRDVADLVDNQEFGLAIELQSLLDAVLGVGLGQRRDERHSLNEVGSVAFSDSLYAQGHGQVGLAHTGRPQQDDVLAVGDKSAFGQLLDAFLIDRGLESEVEALERLDVRELGQRCPEGDRLFLLGGNLLGKKIIKEVSVGDVVHGRLLQNRLQPLMDPIQPEMTQIVLDVREAHSAPPSRSLS